MKLLFRFMKKADKTKNRIIIPQFIINKYGSEFYLEFNKDIDKDYLPDNIIAYRRDL